MVIIPYGLDQNSNDGGVILSVREDIPSNLVEAKTKPIDVVRPLTTLIPQFVIKVRNFIIMSQETLFLA